MIKFKEFNTRPYDVHITGFFEDLNKKNPDDVFEYVDLKCVDRNLVILVYRQTNRGIHQFRSVPL
ncbi:hypothetical protein ACMUVS_001309 [Enterococcus faecalis]|nr:hypothetical protein [Enterococcus faecalis]